MALSVGELLAYLKLDSAQFNAGIAQAREGMASATGSAERLGGAVGMTERALANAGRQSAVAASGTAKLRAAQLSLVAATERYNAVLADENATIRQLALAEASLVRAQQAVKASTPTAAVAAAGSAATTTAAKMTGLRAAMASGVRTAGQLGIAFGAFELVRKAIDIGKEAGEFQRNMLLIKTNANASASELRNMTKAVLDLAPQVATAPNDLADALYHVEQNGLRGAKALEALRVGAEGAKIGMADVEDTTNTMTIAVASGMHGVENLQKAMGAMIAAAGTGDMRLSQLNEALSTGILSVAKGFGASMQDVAAVLATLGDNGIRGANAATGLRQVMMGFAKPAKEGEESLAKLGLSMHDLGDEMTKHGLVAAMNLLNDKMEAAGITGNKTGAFITEAFGRKAGASLGVLMGEMDRVNTKFDEVDKGAESFGQKWDDTTKTAAFAFQKIGAQIQVAGVQIATKLLPAATDAAMWLGTNIPHAVTMLRNILGPTVHMVGDGLGGAWHVVVGILKVASGVLGTVGHFLERHKALATSVATAVLGMWAAYKGVAIASAALRTINGLLITMRLRMMAAGSTGSTAFSRMNLAMGALGIAIGVATLAWQSHKSAADRAREAEAELQGKIESLTETLDKDTGAITKNTKAWIFHDLAQGDTLKRLNALGISYQTATAAAFGNKAAIDEVRQALYANLDVFDKNSVANAKALGEVLGLTSALRGSKQEWKNENAASIAAGQAHRDGARAASRTADAISNLAAGSHDAAAGARDNATSTDQSTESIKKAEKANRDYIKALHEELAAIESVIQAQLGQATSQDQFEEAVRGVTTQLKGSHDQLDLNSKAGLANRDAFLSAVSAALSLKDAQDEAGGSVAAHTRKLADNIAQLRAAAIAAGADKGEVDKLLKSIDAFPSDIRSKVTLDTGPARQTLIDLMNQINSEHPTIHVGISGGSTTPGHYIPPTGRASGGGLPEGVSSVGERGAELAIKRGSDVQILSHAQSRAFLARTGMRAPGFADGTSKPSTAFQAAMGALSGIQVSILAPDPTALRQFLNAADAASRRISRAAAAGVSPKKLNELRGRLADLVKTANRQLGNLRVKINHADMNALTKSLSGSAADVRSAWQGVVEDLRDAGLGSGVIGRFTGMERHLASHVARRDRLQDALRAARQARAEERSTVTGAVSGYFDVTSAGANPVSGAVTYGGVRAQQLQAKNLIVKWAAGIRKLQKVFGKSKTGIEYLRELAEAGPSTYPQVEALLSGGADGLEAVLHTQRVIDKTAASIGADIGRVTNQPRIDRLSDAIDHQNKVIDKLDHKIEQGIKDGLHGLRIEIDPRGVARLVTRGNNQNAARN